MSTANTHDYVDGLVRELRMLPEETRWGQFKENNGDPNQGKKYANYLPFWV